MPKAIELIYSQLSTGFVPGRAYSNPRFFSTPRNDVSKVYLDGDWPNIRAAYEAKGIPVEQLDGSLPVAKVAEASVAVLNHAATGDARDAIEIPADWAGLKWQPMRALAAKFSDAPVKNQQEAKAAIEAEIARRAAPAAPAPVVEPEVVTEDAGLDLPIEAAGGLTLRELRADIEAAGLDVESDMPLDDLIQLHALAKGA